MSKAILKLKALGMSGLNTDVLPFELPPEFITAGLNFRVRNGYIQPFYGSIDVLTSPGDEECGFLKHVRVKQGDYWVLASRTKVYIAASEELGWTDISSGAYGIPLDGQYDWVGSQLGQLLIVNNPDTYPEYWANEGIQTVLEPLNFSPGVTWQQQGLQCRVIRSHKNFLIAMNLRGSDDLPNGYRISHPADENGLPFTWDTTSRDSIAIQAQLGGDGGEIVDGRTLRDSFVMYSRDSIDILNYSPSSEYYWQRKELSATVGLLSTNCLTEVKGTHYLIVDGDIVMNDGSNITSLLYRRLSRRFNSRTNEYTKLNSFVVRNDSKHELWFCVPEDGSVTASMAYIYNWKDNTWSLSDLPAGTVSMSYGSNPSSTLGDQFGTWRHVQGAWSTQSKPWGTRQLTPLDDIIAAVNTTGTVYEVDPVNDIQEPDFNMAVERTDVPIMSHKGNVSITRIYPTATGAPFTIQIGTQQHADGPVEWSGDYLFSPGIDRYIDVRRTGEQLCYRIKSIGKNRFKISGMEIEYIAAGER